MTESLPQHLHHDPDPYNHAANSNLRCQIPSLGAYHIHVVVRLNTPEVIG